MENHSAVTKTRDAIVKDVNALKKDASQAVRDVGAHASAHVDEAKKRVNDAIEGLQENVASHPLALLGAGFLLGLLFGLRLRR